MAKRPNMFDINCVDPLGRSSLIIAVENENLDMIDMLLDNGIKTKDALLVAIREDYVDGVEVLLKHEEESHQEGTPYSWEAMDVSVANFTADITPLILASHRNNYEILKMLLDRGATIPIPHDVKCSCEECIQGTSDDSLKFSLARINAYRALASPSLISLSSRDPILTAFQLSDELKRLARAESQFRDEYVKLRKQVQEFVSGLIDQARTSYELEVILNHNPDGEPWQLGDIQTLERLKLAIQFKQKSFVAHPSVQQLLATIWYEGLPGFRRKHILSQVTEILKLSCMFPINSMAYIMAPNSGKGKFMRNPFVKFTSHSASYLVFLTLLALASQRIEHVIISIICFVFPGFEFTDWLAQVQADWVKYERGALPHPVELAIICWVQGLVWVEIKNLWKDGLLGYVKELWNVADVFSYGAFLSWMGLRGLAWLLVQKEQWDGVPPEEIWTPRETWHVLEPSLVAEAMFAAGMIGSYLKVVHILSINPYLGPLQIALGKMVIDIVKWLFLYLLVVFAYGCGMNQLLWYYSDLERQDCYSLPNGEPDFENEEDACGTWRRFANLWETSQSLFWASFGLVDLGDFDLKGIKEFTRFWGLLMFGSYSVCNIIVLLNMLIAMMSNSYQIIYERSDMEWKFSRSKLWISYFNPGSTVPAPFNLIPSPKSIARVLCCRKHEKRPYTNEDVKNANDRYYTVMKFIIRRYITSEQRKSEDYSITEDDIQEVRQDISSFKYELIDILKNNNMSVPTTKRGQDGIVGRKSKNMERQIQKGFNISNVEGVMEALFTASQEEKPKDVFKRFAKIIGEKDKAKKAAAAGAKRSSIRRGDQIGSTQNSIRRHKNSLKKTLLLRGNSQDEIKLVLTRLNSEELVAFNPQLSEYPPTARRAYAKFKVALDNYNDQHSKGTLPTNTTVSEKPKNITRINHNRDSIRKLVIEKAKSIDMGGDENDVNQAVDNLEKIIDKDAKEPPKETPKVQEKSIKNEIDKEKSLGKDNAGFEGDEVQVKLIPPSHTASIDESMLLKDPKDVSTKPSPVQSTSPSPKPSAPPSPKPSASPKPPPSPQPPSSPQMPLAPIQPSASQTPPSPQASTSLKPPASPIPPKSPAKPIKSPAKTKVEEKPATADEPLAKFDPDGFSVTGQRRTGWM